mgnify:CR=1 FL=1
MRTSSLLGPLVNISVNDILGLQEPYSLENNFEENRFTGAKVGQVMLDRRLHGPVMTYMHAGKQYIAVAGGGRDNDAELISFALPN